MSIKVITLNVNGIRAAFRKGLYTWLAKQQADFICLQEIKAQEEQLVADFYPQDYYCYYHCAEKKGYSGVAVYAKQKPDTVMRGLGWSSVDTEGRYVQLSYPKLCVASIYLPSGTSGEHRQVVKYDFLDQMRDVLADMQQDDCEYILCGDWNIAHKKIDLKNWRGNQKNSGFFPEERAWMDDLFDDMGFADAFRVVNQEPEQYTWWSNRGQAWAKNVGWRIDYQVITSGLKNTVQSVAIYKDERFSDHAPLTVEYNYQY